MLAVLRGGSWNNNDRNVRTTNRNRNNPDNRNNNIGFRLARKFLFLPEFICIGTNRVCKKEFSIYSGVSIIRNQTKKQGVSAGS